MENNPWTYAISAEFWARFLVSAFLLFCLRMVNEDGLKPIYQRQRREFVLMGYTNPDGIIWIGDTPLLQIGTPSLRFINPWFYLGLLLTEPMSVLPWPISGMCILTHEWAAASAIASVATLWRVFWDLVLGYMASAYPRETRCRAFLIKLLWLGGRASSMHV